MNQGYASDLGIMNGGMIGNPYSYNSNIAMGQPMIGQEMHGLNMMGINQMPMMGMP